MKSKKSAKKKTQTSTECSKCSEMDRVFDRDTYLKVVTKRIRVSEEVLESKGKLILEFNEILDKNAETKSQLEEDIKALNSHG